VSSHAEAYVGSNLSAREREIVSALVVGATAREVARDYGLSFHTVRTHIRNIYEKTGVSCRVELLTWHLDRIDERD
jgi:DNA-binding NarL/FixJ family response regulator